MYNEKFKKIFEKLQEKLIIFCIQNQNIIKKYYKNNNSILNVDLRKANLIKCESKGSSNKIFNVNLKIENDLSFNLIISNSEETNKANNEASVIISNSNIIFDYNYSSIISACYTIFENKLFSLKRYIQENKII